MNKATALTIVAVIAGLSLALDLFMILSRHHFTVLAVTRTTCFAAFLAFYTAYRVRNRT
jgi:hypothetical protein